MRPAVALLAVVMLVSCQGSPQAAKGIVIGGIIPCSGLARPDGPRYAAGTVTVLSGQVGDAGTVVARRHVGVNATYRFVLAPGHYILVADYRPPTGLQPRIGADVAAGQTLRVDIPNFCM